MSYVFLKFENSKWIHQCVTCRRCIEKKQGIIRSEVSQASSLWNWSDHDFISDFYNGKESIDDEEKKDEVVGKKKSDHHIQFRFNSETNCFEEIVM